jgi:hypothetical protein
MIKSEFDFHWTITGTTRIWAIDRAAAKQRFDNMSRTRMLDSTLTDSEFFLTVEAEPAAPLYEFLVTFKYKTRGGYPKVWQNNLLATHEAAAYENAEGQFRHGHRQLKIDDSEVIRVNPHPMIGTRQRFTYPDFGSSEYPEYIAHTGQMVTVIRQLTDRECDLEAQPMFEFVADDGFIGHCDLSELDGTARPLRPQDEQWSKG